MERQTERVRFLAGSYELQLPSRWLAVGFAMNVVGIDIGYSNLKLAYGNTDKGMLTTLRPAGAAPADRFGGRFDGKAQDDFLQ